MFENKRYPKPWDEVFPLKNKLELLSFKRHNWVWEKYLKDAREYWDGDNPDQKRFKYRFGAIDTESNFLEDTKKSYQKQIEHSKLWNNLCAIGEQVEIVRLSDKKDIILTKKWTGQLVDHKELVIELWEKKTFLRQHVNYSCDIFYSGTVVIMPGDPDHIMSGATPGNHKIWNLRGRELEVAYEEKTKQLKLNDAVFKVL